MWTSYVRIYCALNLFNMMEQLSLHSKLKCDSSLNRLEKGQILVSGKCSLFKTTIPLKAERPLTAAAIYFGHYKNLVPISNSVGMEGPAAALQLLRSKNWRHLPVNVEESDPVGGQLQQSFKVFLQVDHCLLQTEADGLHSLTPANLHHSAAGAQVHLCQWGQLTILGHKDVVSVRKKG